MHTWIHIHKKKQNIYSCNLTYKYQYELIWYFKYFLVSSLRDLKIMIMIGQLMKNIHRLQTEVLKICSTMHGMKASEEWLTSLQRQEMCKASLDHVLRQEVKSTIKAMFKGHRKEYDKPNKLRTDYLSIKGRRKRQLWPQRRLGKRLNGFFCRRPRLRAQHLQQLFHNHLWLQLQESWWTQGLCWHLRVHVTHAYTQPHIYIYTYIK